MREKGKVKHCHAQRIQEEAVFRQRAFQRNSLKVSKAVFVVRD